MIDGDNYCIADLQLPCSLTYRGYATDTTVNLSHGPKNLVQVDIPRYNHSDLVMPEMTDLRVLQSQIRHLEIDADDADFVWD